MRLGDISGARRSAERFDRIAAHRPRWSSDDQLTDPRVLAALLALPAGDTARAHDLVVQALTSAGYFSGKRRKIFRSSLILAAETALALRHPAEALRYARDARAVVTLDSLTETRSAYVGEARLVEARALLASGDSAGARSTLARSVEALRTGAGPAHPLTREAERLLATLRS